MRRTRRIPQIPDAINCVKSDNFTQVPNEMLRDPHLSAKAKGILCLLLSNREGWKSHVSTIVGMMLDGEEAVRSGLQELEERKYLLRVQYRDKESKQYQGMVWSYTDIPGEFDTKAIEDVLAGFGMEAQLEPRTGFSGAGFSGAGKSDRNNIKDKKTNDKNMMRGEPEQSEEQNPFGLSVESTQGRFITPSLFDEFWAIYPRKDGKGKAKTSWEKLCKRKDHPTWKQVRTAIHAQKKSERWQDPQYIPLPATWLNQSRWLDDPAQMKNFRSPEPEAIDPNDLIRKHLGSLSSIFEKHCFLPAREIFPDEEKVKGKLAPALITLYERIRDSQDSHLTKELLRLMPGPITIISHYIDWIGENDWIRDQSIRLFDYDGILFERFRRDEAHKDNLERDPITGKSYLGK